LKEKREGRGRPQRRERERKKAILAAAGEFTEFIRRSHAWLSSLQK
jgi:hypothetical protein